MKKRAELLAAIRNAPTLAEQAARVADLDAFDRHRVVASQEDRDLDWATTTVEATLTPVRVHELHTASTEWLSDIDTSGVDYTQRVVAEAASWFGRISPEVKADDEEFTIQATSALRRMASVYGESAPAAEAVARDYVSFLRRREGASGLPQIDQTVAPDGVTPQPTPVPEDVFETFAPPVHPINEPVTGTEDSNRGPLMQEIVGLGNGEGQPEWQPGHQEAPVGEGLDKPTVALGHLYSLADFAEMQAKQTSDDSPYCPTCKGSGAHPWDASKPCPKCKGTGIKNKPRKQVAQDLGVDDNEVLASRRTAADGDSTQVEDLRYPGNFGDSDDNGSAAIDKIVEATGLSADEVRQRFPNPQAALVLLQNVGDKTKEAGRSSGTGGSVVFHEMYGNVTRPQLAAYRKHNISPMDHDMLTNHFGEDAHGEITKWVKDQAAANNGRVNTLDLGREASRREAASGLDQIQQTVAPDGVSQRPTPMPADVAFPLLDETEVSSEQLVDPDPRAAVDKATAAMNEGGNSCRVCGESLSNPSTTRHQGTGETAVKCGNCGVVNYQQKAASLAFTPADAMAHPEFRKGYGFGRQWKKGKRLVTLGTPEFEAGLYAGITDNSIGNQSAWVGAHRVQAAKRPEFNQRIEIHSRFTQRVASSHGIEPTGIYVTAFLPLLLEAAPALLEAAPAIAGAAQSLVGGDEEKKEAVKVATTETDLATSAPGTSPSPVGDTPINGPGKPGPLAGYDQPAAPGGAAPYNGVEPLGQPVVPGAIAPVQNDPAAMVTHTGPPNPLANQQTVAFRRRVQAGLLAEHQEG